jgi:hypothetical protein
MPPHRFGDGTSCDVKGPLRIVFVFGDGAAQPRENLRDFSLPLHMRIIPVVRRCCFFWLGFVRRPQQTQFRPGHIRAF